MRKVEKTPYEFYLYINGNIVCQRYFQVRKFNREVVKSLDLKDMIDHVTNIIQKDLKNKTRDYLYSYYNPHIEQLESEIDRKNIYENEDFFDVELKIDEKTIVKKRFSGNVYPPKVRYSVNIKELIPEIISIIQDTLSQKNYSTNYAGLES
jgi:hypothetical protein